MNHLYGIVETTKRRFLPPQTAGSARLRPLRTHSRASYITKMIRPDRYQMPQKRMFSGWVSIARARIMPEEHY